MRGIFVFRLSWVGWGALLRLEMADLSARTKVGLFGLLKVGRQAATGLMVVDQFAKTVLQIADS